MLEIRSATQDRAGGDGWRGAARAVPGRRPGTAPTVLTGLGAAVLSLILAGIGLVVGLLWEGFEYLIGIIGSRKDTLIDLAIYSRQLVYGDRPAILLALMQRERNGNRFLSQTLAGASDRLASAASRGDPRPVSCTSTTSRPSR